MLSFFSEAAIIALRSQSKHWNSQTRSILEYYISKTRLDYLLPSIASQRGTNVFEIFCDEFFNVFPPDIFCTEYLLEDRLGCLQVDMVCELITWSWYDFDVYRNDYYKIVGKSCDEQFHVNGIFNVKRSLFNQRCLLRLISEIFQTHNLISGIVTKQPNSFTGESPDWRYHQHGDVNRLVALYEVALGATLVAQSKSEFTIQLTKEHFQKKLVDRCGSFDLSASRDIGDIRSCG